MVFNEKKVGIIDFDGGNYRSVEYALKFLGSKTLKIKNDGKFDIEYLVFPGVGSFDYVMKQLKKNNLDKYISKWIKEKKPFLGICVGMQILFQVGFENIKTDGLGLLKGKVMDSKEKLGSNILRPNIGWCKLITKEKKFNFLDGDFFYFNHSYICDVYENIVVGVSKNNGKTFPVLVNKNNIYGIQCHPEKSHQVGLNFIKFFLNEKQK